MQAVKFKVKSFKFKESKGHQPGGDALLQIKVFGDRGAGVRKAHLTCAALLNYCFAAAFFKKALPPQ